VVLAVAHPNPWASASFYLSSQSLADSRCNLYATSRSPHSRRSPSCRFLLCRVALLYLVLLRRRCPPIPCSRGFFSAQLRPPRGVFWPLEFIKLSSRKDARGGGRSEVAQTVPCPVSREGASNILFWCMYLCASAREVQLQNSFLVWLPFCLFCFEARLIA